MIILNNNKEYRLTKKHKEYELIKKSVKLSQSIKRNFLIKNKGIIIGNHSEILLTENHKFIRHRRAFLEPLLSAFGCPTLLWFCPQVLECLPL